MRGRGDASFSYALVVENRRVGEGVAEILPTLRGSFALARVETESFLQKGFYSGKSAYIGHG